MGIFGMVANSPWPTPHRLQRQRGVLTWPGRWPWQPCTPTWCRRWASPAAGCPGWTPGSSQPQPSLSPRSWNLGVTTLSWGSCRRLQTNPAPPKTCPSSCQARQGTQTACLPPALPVLSPTNPAQQPPVITEPFSSYRTGSIYWCCKECSAVTGWEDTIFHLVWFIKPKKSPKQGSGRTFISWKLGHSQLGQLLCSSWSFRGTTEIQPQAAQKTKKEWKKRHCRKWRCINKIEDCDTDFSMADLPLLILLKV